MLFSGDRMTGKCLSAACLFFLGSTLAAAQNPAPDHVQSKSSAQIPAVMPVAVPTPPAMPGSGTETSQRVAPPVTRGVPSPVNLRSLVRSAGIIFSGQVIAVHCEGGDAAAMSSATSITFQVKDGFRGAFPGEKLTIHEWAGLWTRGETYRVGEHVFLFLYPRSRLGFTSPVHSKVGRFEMIMRDTVMLNPWQTELFSGPVEWRRARVSYAEFALDVRRAMAGTGNTIRSGER
jgi:hypothetical protein